MKIILTQDSLETALTQRYAAKRFDNSKVIPADVWSTLESSLVNAPSSYGIQPWKFIVVTDDMVKKQLQPYCYNQPQVCEASHFIIFAFRSAMTRDDIDRLIDRIIVVRGISKEDLNNYRDTMYGSIDNKSPIDLNIWNSRQCYIALGQFMLAASLLGVDTCPMEGIIPAKIDKILRLDESGYTSVVACAAGYRSPEDITATYPKVRFATNEVIIKNTF